MKPLERWLWVVAFLVAFAGMVQAQRARDNWRALYEMADERANLNSQRARLNWMECHR